MKQMSYELEESQSFITSTDPARVEMWETLFGLGTTMLPVLSPRPRWIEDRARAGNEAVTVPAYALDATRLTVDQRRSFARHIAKIKNVPFDVAYLHVHTYPIRAAGCELVETAVCG